MSGLDCKGLPTNADKYDSRRYATEALAFQRVETLRSFGIWPGVVRYRDGKFGLTYDPIRASVTLYRMGNE